MKAVAERCLRYDAPSERCSLEAALLNGSGLSRKSLHSILPLTDVLWMLTYPFLACT